MEREKNKTIETEREKKIGKVRKEIKRKTEIESENMNENKWIEKEIKLKVNWKGNKIKGRKGMKGREKSSKDKI